jgi:hypothetical protein
MIRSVYILLVFTLCIACGTQQKVVENTQEKTTPTINETIIDSVNAQHDSLNTLATEKMNIIKEPIDSVRFIKNAKFTSSKDLSHFSHDTFNTLLQKHVTKDGIVNYKGFKKERTELLKYIASLSEKMPNDTWSKDEKLAYWINAYNAMTVDLILRNYPTKSIKDIKKAWDQRLWKLGTKWYNLDEIEHKILRKMNEPRIHFAINCASFSCPPLLNEAFNAEKLEAQLTQVTKLFLADSRRNTITKDKLEISKIFKWFSKDFKQNGSLIDFLNQYSDIKINANAKKNYKDYNWNLNV